MGSKVSTVLVLAGLVACSRKEPIAAETLVPPNAVPSAPSAAPPPRVADTAPQAPDDAPLPPPMPLEIAKDEASAPKIGASCTNGRACGSKGRVALRVFQTRDFVPSAKRDLPCKPEPTSDPRHIGSGEAASACVADEKLYVELDCIICRMPNRTHVEAAIAELTPQQVSDISKVASLEGKGLRSAAGWQAAIASAAKNAAPKAN